VFNVLDATARTHKELAESQLALTKRLNGVRLGASLAGNLSSELISIASRDSSGE